ncbi:cytochrome c biogenesis protein CcdA [Candidatus Oleimmundimicrobium sp.]|uniref:cytochrome c biogenesis CcdA family protein n=1 Tax=Candidatus Oleimmundimicrobium sp. TaxID=3060597 RepID=UPI00271C6558|nr:cytochrome c biogenesis protein CcdA [Candidatus Oleimmundimicrobium sp.]MDO8886605.1 cytochrome c biogenesis protein CcdA [Candidatus Oleimmundimicrobium sp.]
MNVQNYLTGFLQNTSWFTYVAVFLSGAILSLGSCTIVRIPVIIGYVGGVAPSSKRAFSATLFFVLGLVVTYSLLGVLLGSIGSLLTDLLVWSTYLYFAVGVFAILIGLHLLDLIHFKFPFKISERSFVKRSDLFGAFILGVSFTFFEAPVCPCCGPVMLLIAGYTVAKGKMIFGLTLFFTYALGQSIPLLVLGGFTGLLKSIEKRTHRFEEYVKITGGILLFLIGLYFIWIA